MGSTDSDMIADGLWGVDVGIELAEVSAVHLLHSLHHPLRLDDAIV